MAYELCIFPPEGAPGVSAQTVVEAFAKAGISCKEEPDEHGHWLVLEGHESVLDLTIKDGFATGAGFRYTTEDDPAIVEKVAGAFKSISGRFRTTKGCYDQIRASYERAHKGIRRYEMENRECSSTHSTPPSLPLIAKCSINLLGEESLFRANKTAGSNKPNGGGSQVAPQSKGGGEASAAGFPGRQRRQMANHQL